MTDATPGASEHGSWASLVDAIVMVGDKYRVPLEALITLRRFHPSGEQAMNQTVETIGFLNSIATVLQDWVRTAAESPEAIERLRDGREHEVVDLVFAALLGEVPAYPVEWISST